MRVARPLLAALAVVALVAGCGGSSQHAALVRYIDGVDAIEAHLAGAINAVGKANRAFAKVQSGRSVQQQLDRSIQTMQSLRQRLDSFRPPPAARRLHALLVELVTHEVDLSRELDLMSRFSPRLTAALRPLAAADSRLKRELAAKAKPGPAAKRLERRKAAALETYGTALTAALARLRPLHPPSVWRPGFEAQVSTLTRLRSAASALAAALRAHRVATFPTLLHRFDAAGVANQSTAVQRRQIAAIAAYDRRIRGLVSLAQAVERERVRLQRMYG